jgi:hypothetical protein
MIKFISLLLLNEILDRYNHEINMYEVNAM